ncbi:signal recognition particle receptor subunit alpha, partial [Desulfobulbus sp. F1]|nr:signal recognition particle receptor subunit alpha [Desulfobulbus sp. F1]
MLAWFKKKFFKGQEESAATLEPVAAVPAIQPVEEAAGKPAVPAAQETADSRPPPEIGEEQQKPSMFKRLQERLGKSRDTLVHRLDRLLLGRKKIDQELFDELEELLITADLGVTTAMHLLETAKESVKRDQLSDPQALKKVLRDQILAFLVASNRPAELVLPESGPFVIM